MIVGYRYRFFGKDAEIASKVLGIVAYRQKNFMNASVPSYRVGVHLRRIVNAGYKAAIVKQTENAAVKAVEASKGPFGRDLDCIYTKSTMIVNDAQEQMLMENIASSTSCGHLVSIVEHPEKNGNVHISMVACDVSTGEVLYDEFEDNAMRRELDTRLMKIDMSEVILPKKKFTDETEHIIATATLKKDGDKARVERIDMHKYDFDENRQSIIDYYSSHEDSREDEAKEMKAIQEKILSLHNNVVTAFGLILNYLEQFKLQTLLKTGLSFYRISERSCLLVNGISLRNLEILQNNTDNTEKGSLFWKLNKTQTAFGARLLRKWICHPLANAPDVRARLDAVDEIIQGKSRTVQTIVNMLSTLPDLEKGLMRIYYRKCSPREVFNLLIAFQKLFMDMPSTERINDDIKSSLLQSIFHSIPDLKDKIDECLNSFAHKAARENSKKDMFLDEGSFAKFPNIKKYYAAAKEHKDFLEEDHLPSIRKKVKTTDIHYKQWKDKRYIVEIPVAVADQVPTGWMKLAEYGVVL